MPSCRCGAWWYHPPFFPGTNTRQRSTCTASCYAHAPLPESQPIHGAADTLNLFFVERFTGRRREGTGQRESKAQPAQASTSTTRNPNPANLTEPTLSYHKEHSTGPIRARTNAGSPHGPQTRRDSRLQASVCTCGALPQAPRRRPPTTANKGGPHRPTPTPT